MTIDEQYMKRCLELAKLGEQRTAPNPMVGCVIVHKGKIIGEGFHRKCGEAHAEVNAIASVSDKELLKDSTLYVSLEPCSHFGKTPPCSDLIIKHGIPRVVVGTIDPFSKVSGRGIEKLKAACCSVEVGVLEKECQELNRRFFTFHKQKRPYIILKWAETHDGFIDILRNQSESGCPTWITNEMARIAVHKQRSTEQAIMVGTRTACCDNPSLTLRDWSGKQPLRIVTDRFGKIDSSANLLDGSTDTLVITTQQYSSHNLCRRLLISKTDDLISSTMNQLYSENILSVIVEGGACLLQNFIDRGLWDEAHIYVGNTYFKEGVKAPRLCREPTSLVQIDDSFLQVYRNSDMSNSMIHK